MFLGGQRTFDANGIQEDGVGKAIQALYRDLEYAKSLVKTRARPAEKIAEEKAEKHSDESSESWTMVDEGKKSS